MQEIQYIGEHLLPKYVGQFTIILAFVSALLAVFSYFFATQRRELPESSSWLKIGNAGFIIHGISVLITLGVIFYVMLNKYFEYQYVWQHVSADLPFRYIFSAFWEGQEGSFLLWSFWHVILGFIILRKGNTWKAPVMAIVALVQAFIFSMLLGIYIGPETKIGVNPLLLLRDTMDIPLFNNADYIQQIKGNGLNPLLQNYWMTIHPPVLFLGFASMVIPFSYAIAGLWTRMHKEWLQPALPWVLFTAAALGIGILMGGAWAYEALSFGGYWAWDPVENMSLVPWLTLIAGLHTHLVARKVNRSFRSTYFFYILSFVLILYSTFLTRSGVLGESSVHAFTEMGLESQLLLFIFTFLLIGFSLLLFRWKTVPEPRDEESVASREFWMFIGSLVLFFSATIITASTSLPVYNKIMQLFQPDFKGITITDTVDHYNKYQLWIAVFIAILSGAAQFQRFKEFNWKASAPKFLKKIAIASGIAILLTLLTSLWIQLGQWQYWLMTFAGFFTIAINVDYLLNYLKGNMKRGGSTLAHIGFGIMLVGIIASGLNKRNISNNPMVQRNLLDEEMVQKNVLLFKGTPMYMSGFRVTYERDTMEGNIRTFWVLYERLDAKGNVTETFRIKPEAIYDNEALEVQAFQPYIKRYFHKDIFSHIATLPMREANFKVAKEQDDSLQYSDIILYRDREVMLPDTLNEGTIQESITNNYFSIDSVIRNYKHPDYRPGKNDFAFGLRIKIRTDDTVLYSEPGIVLKDELLFTYPTQVNDLSLKLRLTDETLNKVLPSENDLGYKTYTLVVGDEITLDSMRILFTGFNKEPDLSMADTLEGDIVLGAGFKVFRPDYPDSITWDAEPVYLIRGNSPFNLKDEIPELGMHFRFMGIDPVKETIDVAIARKYPDISGVPLQLARNSYRSDYIVLEAIVFPGINLFWFGSLLMMIGLGVAMIYRLREKRKAPVTHS